MKRILMILFFAFFSLLSVKENYGQEKYGQIGFCQGNCFIDTLSELALTAGNLKDTHNILIRLCTKDRPEIALSKARFNLDWFRSRMKTHRLDESQIPILLSKSCANKKLNNILFQVLAYSKEYKQPPFEYEDKLNYGDFEVTIIEGDSLKIRIDKFIQLLKESPDAYGTIFGEYNYYPSSTLKRNIQKAKLFLRKKKVPSNRYFTQFFPSGFTSKPPDPEPNEPIIQLIEIKR